MRRFPSGQGLNKTSAHVGIYGTLAAETSTRAANTILSFYLLYAFDGRRSRGGFGKFREMSSFLCMTSSAILTQWMSCLTSRFFSKCLISECVLSCSAMVSSQKGCPVFCERRGYDNTIKFSDLFQLLF